MPVREVCLGRRGVGRGGLGAALQWEQPREVQLQLAPQQTVQRVQPRTISTQTMVAPHSYLVLSQ